MGAEEGEAGRRTGELLAGRHRLGRLIGEGGFGVVYEAIDETTSREVAVKLLHPHLGDVREVTARFRREAAVMKAVRHPNVVEVLDAGATEDGTLYFAMERLHGIGLSTYLESTGPLRIGVATRIAAEIADALAAVHASGIVHRDLKPDNVFLVDVPGGSKRVKLLDFGVAKVVDGSSSVSMATRTGTTVGTAYYMAPEQAQAKKDVDSRADLYALGVMIFRMLAGVHPFEDDSYPLLVVKICTEPPPSILAYRADVPPGLSRLIASMLSKDPALRPTDAEEVVRRLSEFHPILDEPRMLEGHDRTAMPRALRIDSPLAHAKTMAHQDAEEPLPELRRRSLGPILVGSIAVVLAAVGIGAWVTRAPSRPPEPPGVSLPHPQLPMEREVFEPATNGEGYRFLNPRPRALPSFHDVAIGGPGIVAYAGRSGSVFLYAGRQLSRLKTGTAENLHSVAWVGNEDLITVGDRGTLVAIHGHDFRSIDTHVEVALRDIAVISPREWILVGDHGTFLRVVGEQASAVDTGTDEDLLSVTTHGDVVFAVGTEGTVLRWDHRTLARENSGTRRVLRAIHACPNGDLYAVGDEATVLHRSNDGRWGPVATRARETFHALACRDSRLYAAGDQGGVLVIGGLRSVRLDSGDERALFGIDAMPGAGIWAVGAGGRLVGVGPDRVLRFTSGRTATFFDAAQISGVWVSVGAGGSIARAPDDGDGAFTEIASPLASGFGGIASLDDASAVVVGDLGAILAVTLRGARVLASPTENNLRDVVASGGAILAVGAEGTVVRGSEGAFVMTQVEGHPMLRAIVGTPASAFAVGDDGVIVHLTETTAERVPCDSNTHLRGVYVDGAQAFAVGDDGLVLRVESGACVVEHRGGPRLSAIGAAPDGGLLAVGEDGAAFRRKPDGTYEALSIDTGGLDLFAVASDEREVLLLGAGGVVLRRPRMVVPSQR